MNSEPFIRFGGGALSAYEAFSLVTGKTPPVSQLTARVARNVRWGKVIEYVLWIGAVVLVKHLVKREIENVNS